MCSEPGFGASVSGSLTTTGVGSPSRPRPVPKLGPFEIDHNQQLRRPWNRAESRVFRAAGLTSDPWGWRMNNRRHNHAGRSDHSTAHLSRHLLGDDDSFVGADRGFPAHWGAQPGLFRTCTTARSRVATLDGGSTTKSRRTNHGAEERRNLQLPSIDGEAVEQAVSTGAAKILLAAASAWVRRVP